jgi:hypothetical protein
MMMEWFKSGGFGMFTLLAVGAGSIGYGLKALLAPTAERVAALRALPGLLVTTALFSFGINLWAVNRALESDTFANAHNIPHADMPIVGLVGFTEAAQTLTLGCLLAMVVTVLRIVAAARHARG